MLKTHKRKERGLMRIYWWRLILLFYFLGIEIWSVYEMKISDLTETGKVSTNEGEGISWERKKNLP
ncbi:hypothetical protein AKJ37_06675 [candidate division MSBL1 archaeon SCGC-AAA259I09]|uniref:Uncharacterized protein n=4 Tax=candidate division MSBL1 TaxID=215777 RepID=A0A133UN76_9EURY|nr:hypothetical protein AKJ62_03770 [candidate division MSBL1 archaeon SCGC-AAA259D14]KXA94681.1 hypothetical protein AKJ36_02465 [candidate division MSBL1 archaeon SCGC-AAA259I07]KXA95688.1 hypothetical protein AKJ37_06675 [candidate division MSBL1 archaeon SCGC-AAA259I09]KXA98834.1 hypothetical protein AKJ39_00610 [candidate division MSBL1 archaeon SCGC-AAA259J03]